ncbi:MAG: hypothetical protein ACR2PT_24330 [Endozoicomonas sp.]
MREPAIGPTLSWRFREACLFLSVLLILMTPSRSTGKELPPWTPPHIAWEISASKEEVSLWPVVKNYAVNLPSTMLLILTAYSSYHSATGFMPASYAAAFSSFSTRMVDFSLDSATSSSVQDLGVKSLLSNLDLANPLFPVPWFARRFLVMLYSLWPSITRVIPWPETAPTLVYLHDKRLTDRLHIVWVPASDIEEQEHEIARAGYFEISVTHHQESCTLQPETEGLVSTLHGLACVMPEKTDLKFRLYPRSWEGQNRLFIQAFRNDKAGRLFLSPYDYGDEREVRFITDTARQSHDFHLEHRLNSTMLEETEDSAYCLSPLHSKVATPLHETSFELLAQVMARSEGHYWDEQPNFLSDFVDAAPMAETLDTSRSGQDLELYFDSIEAKTLTVVTAGEQSLLFLDWGESGARQPVFSLATGFTLDNIAYSQLLALEALRPGFLHDAWKLTFDILQMTAAQYLTSRYAVPLFEDWVEKIHTALGKKFTQGGTPRTAGEGEQGGGKSGSDGTSSSKGSPSDDSEPSGENRQSNGKKSGPSRAPPGFSDSSDGEDDDAMHSPSETKSPGASDVEDSHPAKKKKTTAGQSMATWSDRYQDSDNDELDEGLSSSKDSHSPDKQNTVLVLDDTDISSFVEVTTQVQQEDGNIDPKPMEHESPPTTASLIAPGSLPQEQLFIAEALDAVANTVEVFTQPDNPPPVRSKVQTFSKTRASIAAQPPMTEETRTTSPEPAPKTGDKRHSPRKLVTTETRKDASSSPRIRMQSRLTDQEKKPEEPRRKRGRPPKNTKERPPLHCILRHCTNTEASEKAQWQHFQQAHIIKSFFGVNAKEISIGNVVVYRQEDLNCRVGGCNRNFEALGRLAEHLKEEHSTDELDNTPFNPYWKGKLTRVATTLGVHVPDTGFSEGESYQCQTGSCSQAFNYENDQQFFGELLDHKNKAHKHETESLKGFIKGDPLSTMSNTAMSKRYLSRHGDGWHCHDCSDPEDYAHATIKQTPEGLGDHWFDEHLDGSYMCPVEGCTSRKGKRARFKSVVPLMKHILKHKSATLDVPAGDPGGWLDENDIFPFTINPHRGVPQP